MSVLTRFEKLSPREQRLLQALAIVFAAILALGTPVAVGSSVATAREHNADIRSQLTKIANAAPLLVERRDARQAREVLYGKAAVPLASFIDNAAKAQDIDIPESSDQPDAPTKGYVEHSTQAKFRKVGLRALVNALEQMEKSGLPVAITALHVSARAQADEYDVSLTVSQYEKKGADAKKPGVNGEPKPKGQAL